MLSTTLLSLQSCVKDFVPSEKAAFSLDMAFTQTEFRPILGRNYDANFFNDDLSSRPLTFRILNMRAFDGSEAPVLIWKEAYTGLETSLEEIDAKREIVNRPLWEIGLHSGSFSMWNVASSDFIRTEPDSCYVFDVEVSNSGGKRYFRDFKLKPQKEDPSTAYFNLMPNVVGDSTRQAIFDSEFWLNRVGDGNSITFKFLDPKLQPIKLSKFNGMTKEDWKYLVHGFNPRFAADSTSVTYDVAYPIPLVPTMTTRYNMGSVATSTFRYNRIAFGGDRITATLNLAYTIHQKGDWEIIVYFPTEAPLFDND
jgi:hypothetical protein